MPDLPTPIPGTPGLPAPAAPVAPPITYDPTAWRESIPADLREHQFFTDLGQKSLGEVLKAGHEAHLEVGRRIPADKAFQIPTDPNSPEWEKLWSAARPATAAEYTFKPDAGLGWTPEEHAAAQQNIWDLGMPDAMAARYVGMLAEGEKREAEAQAAEATQREQADLTALRLKWGPDYEQKAELAARVATEFGALEYAKETGLLTDPMIAPILAALGALTAEGRVLAPSGQPPVSADGASVETIQSQLDQLRTQSLEPNAMLNPDLGRQIEALTAKREEAKARQKQLTAGYA